MQSPILLKMWINYFTLWLTSQTVDRPRPTTTDYQDLTRFNKIATQGAPQMAVDKEANSLSRVHPYYSMFNLRLFYV